MTVTEPFVFISHSSKDNAYVRKLADDWRTQGINVWVDFEAIEDGARWLQRIEQAVTDCDAAVIVMSAGARESEWVEREGLMLLDLRKPLFIAMIEPTPLPLHLITRQFTNFINDYDAGFRSLTKRLRDVLNKVPEALAAATPEEDNTSPDPDEGNFFAYIAQMNEGEEMSLIAQDLYYWAKKEVDSIEFGGRHSPCFHARVHISDKAVTVFSLQAYLRHPAVQVPFDYLSKYPPYTDGVERLKTLRALDKVLQHDEQFNETRANRRPSIALAHLLGDAERLEQFKGVISEIINRLHAGK
jgi:hypothetical protein